MPRGDLVVADRVPLRHAACGYRQRRDTARGFTETFCGTLMALPQPEAAVQHCPRCVELARLHAQQGCQCWKLWKGGKLV